MSETLTTIRKLRDRMDRAKEFVDKFDGELEFSTAAWQGSQLKAIGPDSLSSEEAAALEELLERIHDVYLKVATANLRVLQTMTNVEGSLGIPLNKEG